LALPQDSVRPAFVRAFFMPEGCHVRMTFAFGSLVTATGGVVVATQATVPLFIALGLVALHLAGQGVLLALFVCRPADRKDLLKFIKAWRGR
jgi:hypothetical protein